VTYTLRVGSHNQMRIKNKYIRNRHAYKTAWNRVRSKEHPYETLCPYLFHQYSWRKDYEDQVKYHFEQIEKEARKIVNGSHKCSFYKAPARYRRNLNHTRKAKERNVMAKIRQGDYDLELPKFKRDAAYDYW